MSDELGVGMFTAKTASTRGKGSAKIITAADFAQLSVPCPPIVIGAVKYANVVQSQVRY
jgi:hypothetical protein